MSKHTTRSLPKPLLLFLLKLCILLCVCPPTRFLQVLSESDLERARASHAQAIMVTPRDNVGGKCSIEEGDDNCVLSAISIFRYFQKIHSEVLLLCHPPRFTFLALAPPSNSSVTHFRRALHHLLCALCALLFFRAPSWWCQSKRAREEERRREEEARRREEEARTRSATTLLRQTSFNGLTKNLSASIISHSSSFHHGRKQDFVLPQAREKLTHRWGGLILLVLVKYFN